ncbi:MAG: putative peptidoglycan glycosyltransferase FtsW [Acutalibacteraceae bacterium]|nr:putative peptidoglycan glycosyltransferase FtsW [Acutalibacteraceae bacterium]
MANRRRRKPKYWTEGGIDIPFLAMVIALVVIGLLMMFSASYSYCVHYFGDGLYYFKRQLVFVIIGVGVMLWVSRFDYEQWKLWAYPLLILTYILLILVLVVNRGEDFKRWLPLGPLTFQPSEIAKFSLVLFLAMHEARHYKGIINQTPYIGPNGRINARTNLVSLGIYGALIFSMCLLVYEENHVSGTILLFLLGLLMIYLAGYSNKGFAIAVALVVLAAIIVVSNPDNLPGHAQQRIEVWHHPDKDPKGTRWQTNHGLYAIGSGGFFGVGIGNSHMKQLYVSEPQNDFIFTIVTEELGFLGAVLILILFGLLVWRGFFIGVHAKDQFGGLLAMGLISQVGIQTVLNVDVVTEVLPNTGISLPFFSYGGTSLLMLLFEMGIILSVSRKAHIKKPQTQRREKS